MLDRQSQTFVAVPPARPTEVEIGLPQLLAFLQRQRWVIVAATLVFMCLGFAYLQVAPRIYSASASVLIDPRKVAIFGSGNVLEDASISNSGIETQVQVIESGRLARAIVEKLDLTHDAEFMAPPPKSPVAIVKGWITALKRQLLGGGDSAPVEAAEDDAVKRAAGIVLSRLSASRVGLSYVIGVGYRSDDPEEAARLANAAAEAYIDDQVQAQVEAAERASQWLQGRLSDLQAKITDPTLNAQERGALRGTYDSFLERYTQTVQQQSLPFAGAQILTAAEPPRAASSPKSMLVLVGSALAGAMIGFGIALARELLDRTVKTPAQVEVASDGAFLGYLPTFDMNARAMRRLEKRTRKLGDVSARRFTAGPAYSITLTAPFSRYTETLRAAKVAAENGVRGRATVLGIISAAPNEGRSTVAINLARLVAEEGERPILIDGDLRNPCLSRSLVPADAPGLAQIAAGTARISEVLWSDQATGLQFLPAGTEAGKDPAKASLTAPATTAIINACRQQFDMVIVDLPATGPVVDVRAAAHLFDGFLMVTEWGTTTEDTLRQASHVMGLEERIIGTVLNKVNMRRLRGFESAREPAVAGNYLHRYKHIA